MRVQIDPLARRPPVARGDAKKDKKMAHSPTLQDEQFTRVADLMPPKDALIDWITPGGEIVRGRWLGGAVWMPEGSSMYVLYVHYKPLSWRLVSADSD